MFRAQAVSNHERPPAATLTTASSSCSYSSNPFSSDAPFDDFAYLNEIFDEDAWQDACINGSVVPAPSCKLRAHHSLMGLSATPHLPTSAEDSPARLTQHRACGNSREWAIAQEPYPVLSDGGSGERSSNEYGEEDDLYALQAYRSVTPLPTNAANADIGGCPPVPRLPPQPPTPPRVNGVAKPLPSSGASARVAETPSPTSMQHPPRMGLSSSCQPTLIDAHPHVTASATPHGSDEHRTHFNRVEHSMPTDGFTVHAKDVSSKRLATGRHAPILTEAKRDERGAAAATKTTNVVASSQVGKLLLDSKDKANTHEMNVEAGGQPMSHIRDLDAMTALSRPVPASTHAASATLSTRASHGIDTLPVPLAHSMPPPQRSNANVSSTMYNTNGKTRYWRDSNYSLVMNSPVLPITTAASESVLLSGRRGLRKAPPASATAPAGAAATANFLNNELNMLPQSPKRESHVHAVVFSPSTTRPAQPPQRGRSTSSHSSPSRHDSEIGFDMWDYMNVNELTVMYGGGGGGDSGNGSGIDTEAEKGEERRRGLPSGGRAVSPARRRSAGGMGTTAMHATPRGAGPMGSAAWSPAMHRSLPSLGLHGDYSFGALPRGSSVSTSAAAADAAPPPLIANDITVASSTSTIGELDSEGSYVNFFNSFMKPAGQPSGKKQRHGHAPGPLLAPGDGEKPQRGTPAADGSPLLAVATDVSIAPNPRPPVNTRLTSMGDAQAAPRTCLDSFFTFHERSTASPGAGPTERRGTAVMDGEDADVRSIGPPPYSSLFKPIRPAASNVAPASTLSATATAPHTTRATTTATTTAAGCGTEAKSTSHSTVFHFLGSDTATTTTAAAATSTADRRAQSTENPVLATQRRAAPLPPHVSKTEEEEQSDEDGAAENGYGYSSQLRLPQLIAPLPPQCENKNKNGNKGQGNHNDSGDPATADARTTDPKSAPHQKDSQALVDAAVVPSQNQREAQRPTARPRSTGAATVDADSSGWLLGHVGGSGVRRGEAASRDVSGHSAERQGNNGDNSHTSCAPPAAHLALQPAKEAAETELDEADANSSAESGNYDVYVYSSDTSSSEEDEEEAEEEEDNDAGHLSDLDSDENAEEPEDALSRRLKAVAYTRSPPRGAALRAGRRGLAAAASSPPPPLPRPTPIPATRSGAGEATAPSGDALQDSRRVARFPIDPSSPPRPGFAPYRPNARDGQPTVAALRGFTPAFTPMRTAVVGRGIDQPSPSPPARATQRLDNSISMHSSPVSVAPFPGRRDFNGFARPQPLRDPRGLCTPHPPASPLLRGVGGEEHRHLHHGAEEQPRSELPSLDAQGGGGGGGLPGGLAIFEPSSPLVMPHAPGLVLSLEASALRSDGVDGAEKRIHGRVAPTRGPRPEEVPSISRTQEWAVPSASVSCSTRGHGALPLPRSYPFTELEEMQRHVGAKWFKFVSLEIRWVPSPGLSPDERGLGDVQEAVEASLGKRER